ncbi:SDR family NAD(P)-dependent oxidoreductase [Mucilaginibacter boryungensis]|uniref:SDR family oxidoreductase n=1 Tax=Mucilaginibacter boryungensis TaxID=768480 RepID=A0ABR9XI71_9SPHI|nr:SDR family oxidoreductase [Mucilaginibacter boryungensis]MBE9666760.1 SDR family oxidoreductase [Mucilaginibacter boryungensis]
MTFDFTNKNVLITGGTRGIGLAASKLFAASGGNVIMTYRSDRTSAESALKELGNGNHSIFQLDVSNAAAIKHFFSAYTAKYNKLDILVNNAGVYLEHKILETDYEAWQHNWEQTIAANLTGPANMCYFAARLMREAGTGKIINISSRGAFRGEPEHPAYGASKAGLNAMSQSLAIALAPHNISVHIIAPGFVETEMAAEILNGPIGQSIKSQSGFNRVAKPEEVARLIAVYASEGLEFTSGGIVDINGASYLRS